MFSEDDILKLKKFCNEVTTNPRAIGDQPHTREHGRLWCDDWEIIEVLKYLFNGRELYIGDPPPNRLKNNPLWSKEDIMQKAENLARENKTADGIILILRERRNGGP